MLALIGLVMVAIVAALVEEASAEAGSMQEQAKSLEQAVGVFRLDSTSVAKAPAMHNRPAPAPARTKPAANRDVKAISTSGADWEEF